LLPNAKVLVVGGHSYSAYSNQAELYDPATGTWTPVANLSIGREDHTATLLPSGKVLVAGGIGITGYLNSAAIYDPATGTWSSTTGTLKTGRYGHTAVLLQDGKVLVAGGYGVSGFLNSAEIYDPAAGTWSYTTGPLAVARWHPTTTLLPPTDLYPLGLVLVAGGQNNITGPLSSSELYNPATGLWSSIVGPLNQARDHHTATLLPNGKVLATGGFGGGAYRASAELYDPASRTWSTTGSLATGRTAHTAALLPNGKVLVTGGENISGNLSSAEIYDPDLATWGSAGSLPTATKTHTATLLPNGKVLVTGGYNSAIPSPINTAALYDPLATAGGWGTSLELEEPRYQHTATLLPDGMVLAAGAHNDRYSAELFYPDYALDHPDEAWTLATGELARNSHTATLLANGKVLMAGGNYALDHEFYLNTSALYDPGDGSFTDSAGSMAMYRSGHTATLLGDGKVLVAGGYGGGEWANPPNKNPTGLSSAEIYNPADDTWTSAGDFVTGAHYLHTATLLPNGKVLVAGGISGASPQPSADLYDPAAGAWTATGSLNTPRYGHTATLLPRGKVLVAGGFNNSDWYIAGAELYDPATGAWTTTGGLFTGRVRHTATLMPDGRVLVAGGDGNSGSMNSAEIYDPATGAWTAAGALATARNGHTATLMPSGKVLVAGGEGNSGPLNNSEFFYPEILWCSENFGGPYDIDIPISPLAPTDRLFVNGFGFRGISGASGGGTNDSSTDYPLVQLRRLDSERVLWVTPNGGNPAAFSATSFESGLFQDFQTGWCLVTVFVNGLPSVSKFVLFNNPQSTAVELASFTAAWDKKRVVLKWETYTEKNNVGFHLWRTEAGQDAYTRLTRDLIPARGTATMGASYSYADYAVVRGREYRYKLEDVDTKGASTFHGPVSAAAGAGGSGKGKNK
jgi:uncharacterized delta-60 repeat protein